MAHEGLWEQLDKLNRLETAQRAKCQYLNEPERYVIRMLNTDYVVNLSDRDIVSIGPDLQSRPVDFLDELVILTYLINTQDLPLSNKLVSAEELPGGQFFFRGMHSLPTEKLEKFFGESPEVLYERGIKFGAKRCEYGDASIEFYILPRLPLTIVIWRKDDEFAARASILFDRTAAIQLPLDALLAAVNLAVKELVGGT